MAGFLGACASPATPVAQASKPAEAAQAAKPAEAAGTAAPVAKNGNGERTIIGAIKEAETAFSEYARARQKETALREAAKSAADAALVARHRQSIGGGMSGVLIGADADQRLANAEQQLKQSEAATLAARERLYRVLGLSSDKREGATVPVKAPGESSASENVTPLKMAPSAPRFAPSRLL